MKNVEQLLLSNLINDISKINNIQKFKKGYLNDNYLVNLKNQKKYVVRICKPNVLVNRNQEYDFMNAINITNQLIYYDLNTGNYIRNYYLDKINAKPRKCYKYLHAIIKNIQRLHNCQINNQINQSYNFEMYVNLKQEQTDCFFNLYKQIITNIKNGGNLKMYLSHNDLNPANILATKNDINFIDYEFSCLNYDYFDYGYFFKEIFLKNKKLIKLSKQYHWDYQLMLSFIYLATYISYAWSKQMSQTNAIVKYQKKILKRLNYYYKILSKL